MSNRRRREKKRKRAAVAAGSSSGSAFTALEDEFESAFEDDFLTADEFREVADELFQRFGYEFPVDSDSFRWRFDDTPYSVILTGINYDTQEVRFHGPEPAVEYARRTLEEVVYGLPQDCE